MNINTLDAISSRTQYRAGWNLYERNQPVRACRSSSERAGWWAALKADADADTAAHLAAANDDDISDDYEFIRRGM